MKNIQSLTAFGKLKKKNRSVRPFPKIFNIIKNQSGNYNRRHEHEFFEQELRRLARVCPEIKNPVFAGCVCYGDLGGDNKVKFQFVDLRIHEHYEALKATVINRSDGAVDSLLFRFQDVWGKKQVNNRNFQDGIIPHIWTDGNKNDWYVYRPTDADFKLLAAEVGGYLSVFTARDITPEKARTQEENSVVKKNANQSKIHPLRKIRANAENRSMNYERGEIILYIE